MTRRCPLRPARLSLFSQPPAISLSGGGLEHHILGDADMTTLPTPTDALNTDFISLAQACEQAATALLENDNAPLIARLLR